MSNREEEGVLVPVSMIEDITRSLKEQDKTKSESVMTKLEDLLNEPKKRKQVSSPTHGSSEHV
jgi:hypothetical protein